MHRRKLILIDRPRSAAAGRPRRSDAHLYGVSFSAAASHPHAADRATIEAPGSRRSPVKKHAELECALETPHAASNLADEKKLRADQTLRI